MTHDLARPKGLEPLTGGLETRCSIQLSYERVFQALRKAIHRGARILPIEGRLVKQCGTKASRAQGNADSEAVPAKSAEKRSVCHEGCDQG